MRMCTHGHHTMLTETSKMINFWGRFVYNMVIYQIVTLFISITFFYWQVFLRQVKVTTLLTRFAYNMTLLLINKLGDGHKRVCLDMHHFCSFDNWLCDPISTNWQLMLSPSYFSIAQYL